MRGLTGLVCLALLSSAAHAVSLGQLDDFEDGTTMNWTEGPFTTSPNPPVNVASGGPAGAGDHYVYNESSGGVGAGSRMTMQNFTQWTGDYNAAGVGRITGQMANFGDTPLFIRIVLATGTPGGPPTAAFGSTVAAMLPADGQWYDVSFDLTGDAMSLLFGSDSLLTVRGNVLEMRVVSTQAGPAFQGDQIAGALGADNLRAVVPLPGAAGLFLGALAALGARRKCATRRPQAL